MSYLEMELHLEDKKKLLVIKKEEVTRYGKRIIFRREKNVLFRGWYKGVTYKDDQCFRNTFSECKRVKTLTQFPVNFVGK